MRYLLWLLPAVLLAQDPFAGTVPSIGPALRAWSFLQYYTGTNIQYICKAKSTIDETQGTQRLTISAATNANPVNFTITGHGLGDFATHGATVTPAIRIKGMTGSWAATNGVWVATITGANNLTIPVDSTGFGAFGAQAPITTTTSPRWNQPVWSIQKFFYDGSNQLIANGWASNPGGAGAISAAGGTTGNNFTCSTRTSLSYE